MDDREKSSGDSPPPDGWPASPGLTLALNRTGCFDWDLDNGRMRLDEAALNLFDLLPGEYDQDPDTLRLRIPPSEAARLESVVSQVMQNGRTSYGAYFRVRHRDGSMHWTHTQGHIHRDSGGAPHRVIGMIRDAGEELSRPAERMGLDAERFRQTSVVEETTAALAHARTVQDVLDVLDGPRGLNRLGAASVILGLVEGSRIRLIPAGNIRTRVPESGYIRIEDAFPPAEVVRTLVPRFILSQEEFFTRYPRLRPFIDMLDVTAAAYMPLIAQARPIGALGLLYQDKSTFTGEERTLFTALTSTIAQSLQRAMLFEQEHELAESLQQSMLPHRIPDIPGLQLAVRYRSASHGRDIGGDWYDVIPLPGGRVAAVIGDVQGHDTHAAAVMGQVRIVLRAYAAEGHSASTVMARASAFLHDLDTERFATCLYAEADPSTGWLRLVRAGHPPPLLRRRDGSCRSFPVLGALPLGLSTFFGQTEYPVTTMELEPGETLLMFTDGLVEEPGGDMTEAMQDLADSVLHGPSEIHELADHLSEGPAEWAGTDDMALVLLHREADAAGPLGRRLHQHVAASDPRALAAVREMVLTAARSWHAEERADDVVLVADELVANALVHTDGGAVVTVRALGGDEPRIRVEVTDRSSSQPQQRNPGHTSISGRGLLLVDRLADVWGVESRGTGKCVWCEFLVGNAGPDAALDAGPDAAPDPGPGPGPDLGPDVTPGTA